MVLENFLALWSLHNQFMNECNYYMAYNNIEKYHLWLWSSLVIFSNTFQQYFSLQDKCYSPTTPTTNISMKTAFTPPILASTVGMDSKAGKF